MSSAPTRVWLAGIPVDLIGEGDILALLARAVERRERIVLANANLHALHQALGCDEMLALLTDPGTVVHVDGTPIVWAARLLRAPVPAKVRNTHVDLIPRLLTLCAERGWPVVIVGGDAAAAAENERALAKLAPGLVVYAFDGYFEVEDISPTSKQMRTVAAINACRPALLLVGMGMPRQERWIAAHRHRLDVPVIMPVGGFADYFAGRTRMPPRFLGRIGAEWLFRLAADPRRLAFRYLAEPLLLAGRLARATARGARWGRQSSAMDRG